MHGYVGLQSRIGVETVGKFMTRKENLHVVKTSTTIDRGDYSLYFISSTTSH